MRGLKLPALSILLASSLILASPLESFAAIQSLNGLTGQTQTFQNDTNVTVSSANRVHSLRWQGLLSISRGGTNASTFTNGSIFFFNGTSFSENNSNLFWDNSNNRLGVGTSSPTQTLQVSGDTYISGSLIMGDTNGGGHHIFGVNAPDGSGLPGGSLAIVGGAGSSSGGNIEIRAGYGGDVPAPGGGAGGNLYLIGGDARGGNANGGNVEFKTGLKTGPGQNGVYRFINPDPNFQNIAGILNFSLLNTSDKTFTFPNTSGTFGLLESDQTWTGLNKFEGSSSSTIYLGSSTSPGCIVMGDTASGVGYITLDNGVLTVSTTKPSICQ